MALETTVEAIVDSHAEQRDDIKMILAIIHKGQGAIIAAMFAASSFGGIVVFVANHVWK